MRKIIKKIKAYFADPTKMKIIVHPVTILMIILSIFVGLFWLCAIYFSSLVFHELVHAVVANKLGYSCKKIVLYPTGALLSGNTDEFSFKDEIIVSLAGPLSNLCLCVLLVFCWWIFPEIYNYTTTLLVANLSLALFNLLPIFPLDGGRVLLAFLSSKTSRKNASTISKIVTIVFSVVLFAYFLGSLFFAPNFQIGITSLVIFISAFADDKELAYKRIMKSDIKQKRLARGIKCNMVAFGKSATLSKVCAKIDNYAFYVVVVLDENMKILAKFSERQIEKFATEHCLSTTLGELLRY